MLSSFTFHGQFHFFCSLPSLIFIKDVNIREFQICIMGKMSQPEFFKEIIYCSLKYTFALQ